MRGPIGSRGTSRERGDEVVLGRGDQRRLEGGDAASRAAPRRRAGSRPRPRSRSRRRRSRSPAGRRGRGSRSRCRRRRSTPTAAMRPSAISTSPRRSTPSTTAASTPSLIASASSARADRRRPLPRAARARVGGVEPVSSETIATFASPSAASSAASTSASETSVASATARRARARSFALLATTSTIRFPYVRPSRTIVTVEIVFRTSFCAVPAFIRVEPAITSGPTTATTSWSASRPSSESREHTTRDRQRAGVGGRAGGAERRRACCRSPRARRPRPPGRRRRGGDVLGASQAVVLGRLLRHGVGARAAGDDREDPAVGEAERRAALGGVDEREPAGRAGADVDQPAAALRAARRSRRSRLRAAGAASRTAGATRASSSLIELDELDRREQVDVGVQRLALLGDGLGPLMLAECNTGAPRTQWIGIDHLLVDAVTMRTTVSIDLAADHEAEPDARPGVRPDRERGRRARDPLRAAAEPGLRRLAPDRPRRDRRARARGLSRPAARERHVRQRAEDRAGADDDLVQRGDAQARDAAGQQDALARGQARRRLSRPLPARLALRADRRRQAPAARRRRDDGDRDAARPRAARPRPDAARTSTRRPSTTCSPTATGSRSSAASRRSSPR